MASSCRAGRAIKMNYLLDLLKLGLVGLIAALFSYFLAGLKHREEKWWELRVAAYKEVIAALSDLYYYFTLHLNAEETGRELTDAMREKLDLFWEEGYHKVRKAADTGAFLFSAEAEDALQQLIKDEPDYKSYFEYVDNRCIEVKKCLDTLVAYSKKDLQLNHSLYSYLIRKKPEDVHA